LFVPQFETLSFAVDVLRFYKLHCTFFSRLTNGLLVFVSQKVRSPLYEHLTALLHSMTKRSKHVRDYDPQNNDYEEYCLLRCRAV
jgi:hypothetical protein